MLHKSVSPQNEVTSILFLIFTNCGKDPKSVDDLNWSPLNCSGPASPALMKSDGLSEKHPMLDKSTSKTNV